MRQSSRLYGIKVKEHINYYEYDDIKLSYNNGVWIVTSLYDNVWKDGVNYPKDSIIANFNDGAKVDYKIMAQHSEEGSSIYTNYMYDVVSNPVEHPEYGTKNISYRVLTESLGMFKLKVYKTENGIIVAEKEVTAKRIREYKKYNSGNLYPVFNLLFDWNDTSFSCVSDTDYITYQGLQYLTGTVIATWPGNTSIDLNNIKDDTNKHESASVSKDTLPMVMMTKRLGRATVKPTITKDRKTIFSDTYYDHKDVYYNGRRHKAMYLVYDNPDMGLGCWHRLSNINGFVITYADPFWFLMTTQANVEYNGRVYMDRKLLKCWKPEETVNLSLRQTKYRKRPLKDPNVKNFDKIVYDVQCSAVDGRITVTKEINQVPQDSTSFLPSDAPVSYNNLLFRASSTKWSIYSKSGYINFSGHTYNKGQLILTFGINEDVHIEIKDQTNVYEIDEVINYTVKTVRLNSTSYSIWTSKIDKSLKIKKVANEDEAPWKTVYYYDAMYENYIYDDIRIDFDNKTMSWAIISNSDNLYYNGTNYKQYETIYEFGYDTVLSPITIEVTTSSSDSIEIKAQSSKSSSGNQDIDTTIPEELYEGELADFELHHSASKGMWKLIACDDNTWVNGKNYLSGSTIFTLKDKETFGPQSILIQKYIDEQLTNVMYTIVESYDILNNITTVHMEKVGAGEYYDFTDKNTDPKDICHIVTKDQMKTLYGWIWKRWSDGPTPTPDLHRYYFIPICFGYASTSGNGYRYIAAVRVEFGHRYVKRLVYNSVYMRINLTDTWMQADDPNDSTLFLMFYNSHVMNYRFVPSYSGGPTNDSNWSFVNGTSSFPPYPYNNSKYQGLNAYYKKGGSYYYISLLARYGDGGGGENDKYLISKIEFTDNRYYQVRGETESSYLYTYIEESIGGPGDFAVPSGFYNGKKVYNNEGFAYLDEGDYFLISGSLIATGNAYQENLYCVISVDLSSMNMTLVHKTNFISNDEIKNIILTNDDVAIVERYTYDYQPNEFTFMIGKYRFYIVKAEIYSYPKQWHDNNYRKRGHGYVAYKYDIEEGSLTYLGTCTVWYGVRLMDAQTGEEAYDPGSDNRPWRIPDVVSDGVGYCYYKNEVNENESIYEVWEISNPNNFDSIYNGATKVCEYSLEDTVQIINLQWYEYEEFYISSFIESNTIDAKYYDELIEKFMAKSSKKGIFKYAFIQNRTAIFYFPDPTFRNVNGAFMFYADALRSRTELNEEWFSTPQSN